MVEPLHTTGPTDLGGSATTKSRSPTNQIPPQPSREPPHVASRHELGVDLAARDVGATNAMIEAHSTDRAPTRVRVAELGTVLVEAQAGATAAFAQRLQDKELTMSSFETQCFNALTYTTGPTGLGGSATSISPTDVLTDIQRHHLWPEFKQCVHALAHHKCVR